MFDTHSVFARNPETKNLLDKMSKEKFLRTEKLQKSFELIKTLPKVELHVHLEGTMPPELVQELYETYKDKGLHKDEPPELSIKDGKLVTKEGKALFTPDGKSFSWTNFIEFLNCYDAASSVVNCPEAMTRITYEYLKLSAEQGCIYTELTVSPDHLARNAVDYNTTISAVEQGIIQARDEFGIEAGIIVVLVRHNEPKSGFAYGEELVDTIIANQDQHQYVYGIGLAGNEIKYPPQWFEKAFAKAQQAGLGLTAHAGECTDAANVRDAIQSLGVTRIDHGIDAAFDEDTLALLKKENIILNLCLNSNLKLNTKQYYPKGYDNLEHPLTILYKEGINFSLSTDDPPYFDTNLLSEYEYATLLLDLEPEDLIKIIEVSIQHSFAPEDVKQRLLEKLKNFAVENDIHFNSAPSKAFSA